MKRRNRVPLTLLVTLLAFASLAIAMMPGVASASSIRSSDESHLVAKSRPAQNLNRTELAYHMGQDNLNYYGGPVMTGVTHTYAIFWEPSGNVSVNYNHLIKRYFRDIGKSPLYRIAREYPQANGAFPTGSVPGGSWVDTRPYPESPLMDSDIQNEVRHAQRVNGWHSSMRSIFFVFLERDENVCMDNTYAQCASNQFCAYHSAFGRNTIYAALPYIASYPCDPNPGPNHNDADQTITGISHEQMEAATDPLGNAWLDANGSEIADKCVGDFGHINASNANVVWNGDPYLVQGEWDNRTSSCRVTPAR